MPTCPTEAEIKKVFNDATAKAAADAAEHGFKVSLFALVMAAA